jgi:hypothetical protein
MSHKVTKRLRLTLDFTVTVDTDTIPQGNDQDEQIYNARQKRLVQAILSDQKFFQDYLRYQVTGYLEGMTWQDWYGLLLDAEDVRMRDVLQPIIDTLSPADQQFFQDVEEHGVFLENVEDADNCFTTTMDEANLTVVDEDGAK